MHFVMHLPSCVSIKKIKISKCCPVFFNIQFAKFGDFCQNKQDLRIYFHYKVINYSFFSAILFFGHFVSIECCLSKVTSVRLWPEVGPDCCMTTWPHLDTSDTPLLRHYQRLSPALRLPFAGGFRQRKLLIVETLNILSTFQKLSSIAALSPSFMIIGNSFQWILLWLVNVWSIWSYLLSVQWLCFQ